MEESGSELMKWAPATRQWWSCRGFMDPRGPSLPLFSRSSAEELRQVTPVRCARVAELSPVWSI